jgi:trigger factor
MTQEELAKITVEKQPGSEVLITGEVPYAYLDKYRAHAVEHVGAHIEMDGFRKGHIPESILVARVGEMALIQDMAEHSLEDAYREIVAFHKLDVIGYPKMTITKLAKDNPLGFNITVAVMPQISLPDYTKIAAEVNKARESKEVTEDEVTKQIEDLLRQKVAYERLQEKAKQKAEIESQKKDMGDVTELPTPENIVKDEEPEDPSKLPLPELTDEYVKTLGKPGAI